MTLPHCFTAVQKVDAEDLEIARLLLDAGYELNDVPHRSSWYKFGGTAIKMAAEHGATDIVQLFLDRGADPDTPGGVIVNSHRPIRLYSTVCLSHISVGQVTVGYNG